jgi:hypothetical protein
MMDAGRSTSCLSNHHHHQQGPPTRATHGHPQATLTAARTTRNGLAGGVPNLRGVDGDLISRWFRLCCSAFVGTAVLSTDDVIHDGCFRMVIAVVPAACGCCRGTVDDQPAPVIFTEPTTALAVIASTTAPVCACCTSLRLLLVVVVVL